MGMGDPALSREEEERERRIYFAISRIAVFPGSIAEYETWKNYAVEVIDTQRNDKGVRLTITEQGTEQRKAYIRAPDSTIDLLVENQVEAIVNAVRVSHYRPPETGEDFYGLPVRRKKEGEMSPDG